MSRIIPDSYFAVVVLCYSNSNRPLQMLKKFLNLMRRQGKSLAPLWKQGE